MKIVSLIITCSLINLGFLLFSQMSGKIGLMQAQTCYDKRFHKVRSKLLDYVKEGELPSIAVAVAQDGKIIWEEAFGWADRENLIKATPNTIYSLASISKTFTATALMTLVEKGFVNLNKPIDNYLGKVKIRAYEGDAEDATVKRVLNHRAGLPPHYNFFTMDDPGRYREMDETIRRYGIICYEPGWSYVYSNLGYGLIEYVISRISNKTIEQFMKQEIFLPLGLMHSSFGKDPSLEKYYAKRYDALDRVIPLYTYDTRGASNVSTSIHDLIRFGMFHLKNHLPDQKRIIRDKTIDLMQKDDNPQYGLGWQFDVNELGYRSVYHGGNSPGVNSFLRLVPSENFAYAILYNKDSGLMYTIMKDIFHTLIPEKKEKQAEQQDSESGGNTITIPEEFKGMWKGEIKARQ